MLAWLVVILPAAGITLVRLKFLSMMEITYCIPLAVLGNGSERSIWTNYRGRDTRDGSR